MRYSGTTIYGSSFSTNLVAVVWAKGTPIPGYDPNIVRLDSCGVPIMRGDYGKITKYGWEIDHICPVSHGGSDDLFNLQPLQWQNNRHKGDNWPQWSCLIGAGR